MNYKRERSDSFEDIPGFQFVKKVRADSQGRVTSLQREGDSVLGHESLNHATSAGQDLILHSYTNPSSITMRLQGDIRNVERQTKSNIRSPPPLSKLHHPVPDEPVEPPTEPESGLSLLPGQATLQHTQENGTGSVEEPYILDFLENDNLNSESSNSKVQGMGTHPENPIVVSGSDDELTESNFVVQRDVCNDTDDELNSADDTDDDDYGPRCPYLAPVSPELPPALLGGSGHPLVPNLDIEHSDDTGPGPQHIGRLPSRARLSHQRAKFPKPVRNRDIQQESTHISQEQASGIVNISLPAKNYGRARRLVISNLNMTLVQVVISRVLPISLIRRNVMTRCSMPGIGSYHVEDACLVGSSIVIGYGRSNVHAGQSIVQVKSFSLEDINNAAPPDLICWNYRPHCYRGIKSLAAVDNIRFLSEGYDKRMHIWTVAPRLGPEELKVPSIRAADAISYIPEDKTVLRAGTNYLQVFNIEKPTPIEYVFSTSIQHIHPSSQRPEIVVLEVKDLDEQIHVFDRREPGFGAKAVIRFGYRPRSSPTHYTRGSLRQSLFTRGYEDGFIGLWDFRKSSDVVVKLESKRETPTVHTVFSGVDVVAFGGFQISVYENVV